MPHSGPIKMLIVEDNAVLRQYLRDSLSERFPGARVFEARDLPDGRRIAQRERPDVIVMDLRLPGGSGLALTAELLREWPEARVIVCTNHDLPEYREAALACGAVHFVAKGSLTLEGMGALVEQVLDRDSGRTH